MQSINVVLSFPQAHVKNYIYLKPTKVPKDLEIPDLPKFTDRYIFIYKLINSLYGLKGAGETWYDYLKNDMIKQYGINCKLMSAYLPITGSY